MRVMVKEDKALPPRVVEIIDAKYDVGDKKLTLSGVIDSINIYDVSAESAEEIMQKLFDEGRIDLSNNPTNEKAVR